MARIKYILPIILSFILVLFLMLVITDSIQKNYCINKFYLSVIKSTADTNWLENESCSYLIPDDDETSWWQGYLAWNSGLMSESVSYWKKYPNLAVDRIISLVREEEFPEDQKVNLLQQGLISGLDDEKLIGRLCFFIINELIIEDAYQIVYQVWDEHRHSPSINASLAYILSRYNPEEMSPNKLILEAYKKAPDNYYVLIFGYRLYLENNLISEDKISEFAKSGENLFPHDKVMLQNLTDIYTKLGNYEKAYQLNMLVLEHSPLDVKVILRQLELVYLTERTYKQEWIDIFLANITEGDQYSQAFYQRAIYIMVLFDKFSEAQQVYCLGQTAGFESSQLVGDSLDIPISSFETCK